MKTLKLILACLLITLTNLSIAQVKKKIATPTPISHEGHLKVERTPKAKIFKKILASEQELVNKKQSTIIETDSIKGIIKVKRAATCDFQADTTLNGKIVKNAATKSLPYNYEITYNIGDNLFTYQLHSFTSQQGKILMKNDPKTPTLSSCAESQIWRTNDIIIANGVLMGL